MLFLHLITGKQKKDARKSVLLERAGRWIGVPSVIQFVVANGTSLFLRAEFPRFLPPKEGWKQGRKSVKPLQLLDFFVLS